MVRIDHAQARQYFSQLPEIVSNAFTRWAGYDQWPPDVQGPAHWLVFTGAALAPALCL